jgi:tripartite-type tricarboxylate transporter receptor subunit TctC
LAEAEERMARVCKSLLLIAAQVLALAFASVALAAEDDFPSKPIHVVIPMAPGGATDILVRPLADRLSKILGSPFIIDNRGGAGGNIGGDLVAKSPPDGYTLLVTTSGLMVANKSLYDKLPFDPDADFAPVGIIASLPNVLAVAHDSPYHSVQDVIAAARKKPGTLTFASGGSGSSNHLAGELLKSLAGIDMVHVPYRGGGPAVIAVMAGDVTMLFATLPSAIPQIEAGRLRPLAVTSRTRASSLPDVPTMIEAGVKDFDFSIWIGALAPRGTPPPIIEKFHQAILQALDAPDIQQRLRSEGYEKVGGSPAQMAAIMKSESATWARVIRAAGIKAQ